jgi:hypothetical protein
MGGMACQGAVISQRRIIKVDAYGVIARIHKAARAAA